MVVDEYLEGILQKILDSYNFLLELQDRPGDLELINTEILKINGFFRVIVKKLETSEIQSDTYVKLLKQTKHYLASYDFEREIKTMSSLYSNDPDRLKNIRLKIVESLQDKKLMETIKTIFNSNN